jgi:hypothetical protein
MLEVSDHQNPENHRIEHVFDKERHLFLHHQFPEHLLKLNFHQLKIIRG